MTLSRSFLKNGYFPSFPECSLIQGTLKKKKKKKDLLFQDDKWKTEQMSIQHVYFVTYFQNNFEETSL